MFTLQRIFYLSGWGIALLMGVVSSIFQHESIFKELGTATFAYWTAVLFLDSFIEEE